MFLRRCSLIKSLFSNNHLTSKPIKFNISTAAPRLKRVGNNRSRSGHHKLLDTFMKPTGMDGSLIVKAPVNLKCSASFFDANNKIDKNKNYKVGLSREEAKRIERANRRGGVYDEDDLTDVDVTPDNGADVFMQMEDMVKFSDEERRKLQQIATNYASKVTNNVASNNNDKLSPIQVSLFGRSNQRVDSYSLVSDLQSQPHVSRTHVYISDAGTSQEAVSMFSLDSNGTGHTVTPPSGQVDIWKPKDISQVEISSGIFDDSVPEEVVSTFKVYCPSHLLNKEKNGISMVFHTPTLMNKIFMEAERMGSIDLNGLLLDQLVIVGLVTECGDIKVKDVWAEDIKLASNSGDVLCYGTMEGAIKVETLADGDFVARYVVGPRLEVTTDRGDISIWDDCHSEVTQLFTNSGNIYCSRLFSDAKICIKNKGVANLNIKSGSVACVVKSGDIITHIDSLSQDSFLEVETGNIIINVPSKCPFRISLVSSRTQIAPHILNSGEFYVKDGMEYFVSGVQSDTGDSVLIPCLTVRCHQGMVSLQSPPNSRKMDDSQEDDS